MELRWERRKLPFRYDRTPARVIDCYVMRRSIEMHHGDVAVRIDCETNVGFALLGDGWTGFFGDQRKPVALDIRDDAAQIGIEVHSLRIGKDVDSSTKWIRRARAELCSIAAASVRCFVESVLDVLASGAGVGIEVGPRVGLRCRRLGDHLRYRSRSWRCG